MFKLEKKQFIIAALAGIITFVLTFNMIEQFHSNKLERESYVKKWNLQYQEVNKAEQFLQKNEPEKALAIYQQFIKDIPESEQSNYSYAHLKNNEGTCYYKIALLRKDQDNLLKAISSFNKALNIIKQVQSRLDFAIINTNLGSAYKELAQYQDKEKNWAEAKKFFNEALLVYTKEDYPDNYQQNMKFIEDLK